MYYSIIGLISEWQISTGDSAVVLRLGLVWFDNASVVQRLDIFWWEDAYSASTAPSPGQWSSAVQQINDVTAQEVEVSSLRGGVVTEGMSQTGFLHKDRCVFIRSTGCLRGIIALDEPSYPHNRFQQTWGRPSFWVRRGRVEAGWEKGLLRAAFIRVRIGVTSRLGHQARGWGRVSETDHFVHSDAVSSVEIHQPVEGAKHLIPDTVLTAPLKDSEMFYPVTVAAKEEWWVNKEECEK